MNTTQLGIMRSILADPDCDTPRLVFADACEESGQQDRADFIRCQLKLAAQKPIEITCRGCGKDVVVDEQVCDGCICNSLAGVNHGLVPDYVCVCSVCDPKLTGSVRPSPLRRRERELHPQGSIEDVRIAVLFGLIGATCAARAPDWPRWEYRRGFIGTIRCDWATWLAHHERLFWSPRQTVECDQCSGMGYEPYPGDNIRYNNGTWADNSCSLCSGSRRVPRPCPDELAATAQPITRLELTDLPPALVEVNERHFSPIVEVDSMGSAGRMKWSRVKCPTCHDLSGPYESRPHCPQCDGTPSNSWTCDAWPKLEIVLPQTQYITRSGPTDGLQATAIIAADYDVARAAAAERVEREYHAR